MSYPNDRKYTKDHEWAKKDGELIVVGITEYAQDALGDVVFVELPNSGASLKAHDSFGSVESVKAVSELFSPISGEVVEANPMLVDSPEAVNQDPHEQGWMIKLKPADPSQLDELMSSNQYEEFLKTVEG